MPTTDLHQLNDVEALWQQLRSHIPDSIQASVETAFRLAERVHGGQFRKTKDDFPIPYIAHPLRVARILVEEWKAVDVETVTTALIHDVIEDCRPPETREHLTRV